MTVTFPDEVWLGDEVFSDSGDVVAREPDEGMLLQLAAAYHAAQSVLVMGAQRSSRDMWLRQRPVDDVSLVVWQERFAELLDAVARQQSQLTASYVRLQRLSFGLSSEPALPEPDPVDVREAKKSLKSALKVLEGSARLTEKAQVALDRLESGRGTALDVAQADRSVFLHSPVIEVRTRLGDGDVVDEAMDVVGSRVEGMVDNHARAVERLIASASDWPSFKNGLRMAYKRVPQSGACGWCRVVATRLYTTDSFKKASGSPWHTSCRCSWIPVTEAEAKMYLKVFRDTQGRGGQGGSEGDYLAAAKAIGQWDGPTGTGGWVEAGGFDKSEWGARAVPVKDRAVEDQGASV